MKNAFEASLITQRHHREVLINKLQMCQSERRVGEKRGASSSREVGKSIL